MCNFWSNKSLTIFNILNNKDGKHAASKLHLQKLSWWSISVKAMDNGLWTGQLDKLHGEGQPEEGKNYITQWAEGCRTETQSLERTTGVLKVPRGPRPSANLSSPIPAVPQTTGVSHRREGGGPGLGEETALPHGCHADCFRLRTIPHHPGFGKCSWSLLVGCKGKKNQVNARD